ncbi:MAG: GntR family transcriptional regulator [Bacteroidota bacterium]
MRKSTFSREDHIYVQVAEGLEKMITDDILKIGDKLPSVRLLSEEYGISMGTAFQHIITWKGKALLNQGKIRLLCTVQPAAVSRAAEISVPGTVIP